MSFDLTHDRSGDNYEISVAVLGASDEVRLPTLYIADANGMFATCVQLAGFLRTMELLQPVLLVGVGYPLDGFFTNSAAIAAWAKRRRALSTPAPGRIEDALDFYMRVLIPAVEASFPAGEHRVVVGGSATGAFALQAWLRRPDVFRDCIALAPASGMRTQTDRGFPNLRDHLESLESEFLRRCDSNARLVQSFGSKEQDTFSMESSLRLHSSLSAAGVASTYITVQGEPHATSWASGFSQALQLMFHPGA